jgi:YVTN family beta-propeller protein
MDTKNKRLDQVISLNVEWNPIALMVDYQRGKVYVANYNYENLSVINILQVIRGNKTGAVSAVTNVGRSVTGIITEPELDRLYLLKEQSGEIIIIRPFSEAFGSQKTTVSPVVGSIGVGSLPRSFILDTDGRKIYVVNRGSDNVSVIDKTTRREEKIIPVGKRPYGITAFPF